MDIKANEIESVDIVGELYGSEVKILKTYGGFNMAVGLKKKGQKSPEVLAAGSHPALVIHQLTKEFDDSFRPRMCKSEAESLPSVEDVSSKLDPELIQKGYEAFLLQKNDKYDFIISKVGMDVVKYEGERNKNTFLIKKSNKNNDLLPKDRDILIKNVSSIIYKKCVELKIEKIEELK